MIAGSRSFAAIGRWAADAGPDVLAALDRGPAEESTFRRAFAVVSADVLDRVLGAWLWTRAVRAGGRLVIAIDGKTIRGAKDKDGKAPHLVAALAHGIGAVLGQVAVDAKSNEIPAVRDLLRFADLAGAVITLDAHPGRHRAGHPRPGRRVRDDGQRQSCRRCTGGAGAAQVAQLRRTVTRNGKKTVEVVYLITSDRDANPQTLATWVRSHWETEEQAPLGSFSATPPTWKTAPWSGPGTCPGSWHRCATWPLASCAWTATGTSLLPAGITPATRSGR
ncbi:MAG TPA: ISAs1 family transposase [Streptosporangiaceae bacterium]